MIHLLRGHPICTYVIYNFIVFSSQVWEDILADHDFSDTARTNSSLKPVMKRETLIFNSGNWEGCGGETAGSSAEPGAGGSRGGCPPLPCPCQWGPRVRSRQSVPRGAGQGDAGSERGAEVEQGTELCGRAGKQWVPDVCGANVAPSLRGEQGNEKFSDQLVPESHYFPLLGKHGLCGHHRPTCLASGEEQSERTPASPRATACKHGNSQQCQDARLSSGGFTGTGERLHLPDNALEVHNSSGDL